MRSFFSFWGRPLGLTVSPSERGFTLIFPLTSPKGEEIPYRVTLTEEEVLSDTLPEAPLLWISPRKDFSLILVLTSPLDAFVVEALCPEVKAFSGHSPSGTLEALQVWRPVLLPLFQKRGVYLWRPSVSFMERFCNLYGLTLYVVGDNLSAEFSSPWQILQARPYTVARDFIRHLLRHAVPVPSSSRATDPHQAKTQDLPSETYQIVTLPGQRCSKCGGHDYRVKTPFKTSGQIGICQRCGLTSMVWPNWPFLVFEEEEIQEGVWIGRADGRGYWAIAKCNKCGEEVTAVSRSGDKFKFFCPTCEISFQSRSPRFEEVFIAPWELQ